MPYPGVGYMAETQTLVDRSTSSEELAYVLLEEARLRCGSMLEDSGTQLDPDCLSLNGLYGDLGIAGYYASARLEPDRRRQLLAQARARSYRGGPVSGRGTMVSSRCEASASQAVVAPRRCDTAAVRALVDVTAAATRTVERALTLTGLLDHMHLAHIHVMSACEALDAMFALQT